ncbi:hypothetical protein CAPTEDRAFT_155434 [Capitella teleta]|uniref:DDB1- and CUL4-associated factor 17 n=1 Tax=Capitella teleta TaxID=283909 RepID=R7TJN1_CAPTE|nr:hypothetical protein CAPTEDRAFT_155434 [Capitella teleta]|eukprot:ELT91751.1 hypothetical protein CAPTEDRAFT_155434 [Capitella teleta]
MRVKSKNILFDLRNREYYHKNYLRRNNLIVRKIICQPGLKFKKTWQKHSKHPISYENHRFYFENFRICYHRSGHGNQPQLLYSLPSCPASQKIEDCLSCVCPLASIPLEHKGYRPHLIALTAHNWLVRYDITTGQPLEQVFLGSPHRYKFKHLAWNLDVQSFFVKSVQCRNQQNEPRNILLCLAFFTVFPLRFTGMLEISRTVFGSDVTDAMISQNCLITMHHGSRVKLYSMEQVIQQGLLHEANLHTHCTELNGVVGSAGVGLPLNIRLRSPPEVLFSVKCADHSVCLGGIPWHYIISKPKEGSIFRVYNLSSQEMVLNGRLEMPGLSIEPDKCMFHADDSGRLLHIGANHLSEVMHCLKEEFEIIPSAYNGKPEIAQVLGDFGFICITHLVFLQPNYTSSGRQVKKKSYSDDAVDCDYASLRHVDYEDDLDIILLTSVTSSNGSYQGRVSLHDNQTGRFLREIELDDPWAECCDYIITLDMDMLVHLIKAPQRHFYCIVYQLQRDETEDDPKAKGRRKSRCNARLPR